MKQQIEITGMTCGGCVKNVKDTLEQIEGVQTVEVSLNPPQAVIEANESISSAQLIQALAKAGGYSITGAKGDDMQKKSGGSCCS
ncbi:heavy-metal-associated domain-containing protein [Bizionia algoritergicola]|uniref:Heavy-metal-associated domain-containing protein n=2 Tax=Flavobacteriaceae TaxID=49546 RepID=A0A5D0QVV8_9FLAO|nr:heavy metal-associated domain-containing protein [Bizionia sp. M204]OBX23350.1 hypothetical protein BAA08_04660 [Bizionia sp. APA-3]TYB73343.1 heavy-metal-associated domain-containing protein [Bizionia algoritergicola]UPS91288.1 hypothetical protein GMA17_05935 [Bizionia sp. M204]